jgi:hypothetical protein
MQDFYLDHKLGNVEIQSLSGALCPPIERGSIGIWEGYLEVNILDLVAE